EQKTRVEKGKVTDSNTQQERDYKEEQGNVTKIIKKISNDEAQNIKWAFKLSNYDNIELNPLLQKNKKGFIGLKQSGASIQFTLKDILKEGQNINSLVDKTITFFAYVNSPTSKIYSELYQTNNSTRENERIVKQDRVTSIELKIIETRFSLDFDGQTLQFLENERVIGEWNASSTNKLKQDKYKINVTYGSENLDLKGIDCVCKDELCYLFRHLNIKENLEIPLNVEYQKRILILIERFKETTESTLARMNIYIDNKRVRQDGKIEDEKGIKPIDDENFPYAYILDRPGPDCIKSEINLRIPEGRYNASWHSGDLRQRVLRLHNDFVSYNRAILIHEGYKSSISLRNSKGCLIIGKERVKDKNNPNLWADNILKADENHSKKEALAKAIEQKGFINSYLAKSKGKDKISANEVAENIEVKIKNNFSTPTQLKETKQDILPNVIRIEAQDGSNEFIEIELPDDDNASNNDDKLNALVEDAKDILYEISPLSSIESAYENLTAGEYADFLLECSTILPPLKLLKAKSIANKIKQIINKNKHKKAIKKSKYATRQDVIDVLEKKYKLKTSAELNKEGNKNFVNNTNVYMAKDNKQIKEIWENITERAEVLKDVGANEIGNMIKRKRLSDGTILRLRKTSRTGGSAIDIGNKKPNTVIHNKAKENGDW
ncbi:DUF5675 family protein, partial [Helicobacter sp. T3_23-1059]